MLPGRRRRPRPQGPRAPDTGVLHEPRSISPARAGPVGHCATLATTSTDVIVGQWDSPSCVWGLLGCSSRLSRPRLPRLHSGTLSDTDCATGQSTSARTRRRCRAACAGCLDRHQHSGPGWRDRLCRAGDCRLLALSCRPDSPGVPCRHPDIDPNQGDRTGTQRGNGY